MYKMLAMDLDGTLLNDAGEIPENNVRFIHKAMETVKVCLCSGRSYLSLQRFEEALGLYRSGEYGICFNGAIVYETATHRLLRETPLSAALAQEIIRALRSYDADIVVYDKAELLVELALARARGDRAPVAMSPVGPQ